MGCKLSRSAKVSSPIEAKKFPSAGKQEEDASLCPPSARNPSAAPSTSASLGDPPSEASAEPQVARASLWIPPAKVETKRFREAKKGFQGFRALMQEESDVVAPFNIESGEQSVKTAEEIQRAKDSLIGLPFEHLDAILDKMLVATFKAGDVVYQEGVTNPHFFVVISGEFTLDDKPVRYANPQVLMSTEGDKGKFMATTEGKLWFISRVNYQQITVDSLKEKIKKGESLLKNLTEIPGLKELSAEDRAAIASALKPVTFKKGEFLMRQGEEGSAMFFIEEGTVGIQRLSLAEQHLRRRKSENLIEVKQPGKREDSSQEMIAYRSTGEYVGEGALLDHEQSGLRNADVVACTDVRCLALGKYDFHEYMGPLREVFEFNLCMRVLTSLDLMRDMPEDQLNAVVSTLEECVYNPGDYIVHEGEQGEVFYIVKEGTVECTKYDEAAGQPISVGTLIAGDYFGEGALLTNEPRRCNVVAAGQAKVKVWGLKRSSFEACFSQKLKKSLGNTFSKRRLYSKDTRVEWDDLEIVRTLGSGSYGTVSLVRNKITGESLALKRIRKATVVAKRQQKFVQQERQILSSLKDKWITNLVGTFNKGDSVYMLTELCLGGELYSLMKETVYARVDEEGAETFGCLNIPTQARFFTACIMLGLLYLSSNGVIHRDLKPENVLMKPNGYVKLADFGFAKVVNEGRTYSLCGTPEYTSPEVYKRCGHGRATDWWAVGVMLYEMSSGFSPFHVVSNNSWDCYIEINKYEKYYPRIQFPKQFSESLCDLLLQLMNPNPVKRLGSRKNATFQVQQHPFFGPSETDGTPALDWQAVINQEYELPQEFRPRSTDNGLDSTNFEDCMDRHEDVGESAGEGEVVTSGAWEVGF